MTQLQEIADLLKGAANVKDKISIATLLESLLKKEKARMADVEPLFPILLDEIETMTVALPHMDSYREKCAYFDYANALFPILILFYPSVEAMPEEQRERVRAFADLLDRERYLERAIDELFEEKEIVGRDTEIVLNIAASMTDEYQRGLLYAGLLNFKDRFRRMDDDAKRLFSDYIASELARLTSLLSAGNETNEDAESALEVAADVCKYFYKDEMTELLYGVLRLGKNEIAYCALDTLMSMKKTVPQDAINRLAEDPVYADITYKTLERYGRASLFPAELAAPEHLAKSDLIHWLTYPTELGTAPDAIEYLGSVKVKRKPHYIFRFRSDSDTLGDELKDQWLIGWSDLDDGTFSTFDLYADFEQKTPEKTLKYIKKKLL